MSLVLLVIVALNISLGYSAVNVGAIFDENVHLENAFHYAVALANRHHGHLLSVVPSKIVTGPFEALQATCGQLSDGVIAVFGPNSPANVDVVQAVCDSKEVPHILVRMDNPVRLGASQRAGTIVNIHPHGPVLSKAYVDIIRALEWKVFTILYEDDDSLTRVEGLLRMTNKNSEFVTILQLDSEQTGNYRLTLAELRQSGQKNIVIDCHIDHLYEVLTQAQQMGLITHEYKYFFTNLDAHTIDLEPFQYGETNITGIRLLNPDLDRVQRVGYDLHGDEDKATGSRRLRTDTALMVDGVQMFYRALKEIGTYPSVPLECSSSESWAQGYSLVNFMKNSIYNGLSGTIRFDNEGVRSDFELEIYELMENGITRVGSWNSTQGYNSTRVYATDDETDTDSLKNKTFIVITCLTDPYGMLKETSDHLYGNDRFEGFGIDLIHELSVMEGFNYTFVIRPDKKNGAKDPKTGKWSGMIGDLMEYRADLAITDLTITSEREEAVDFTSPFMNLGISILFRKPKKAPPSFFSFAEPFAIDTWMCLALAYTVVSISLFVLGRICQDEWTNPFPCVQEPEFLVNQFSMQNSIWFTIGSLMQQGTEIAPIAISTRMVAGMWWFFVLIMVSSYTANLAAFLTNENAIELFSDIYTLVENAEKYNIRYGAKSGGSTAAFFRDSNIPLYKKVHEHMQENPEDMMKENKDGVALAEVENYAFFMESTSIEYEAQRHCDLMQYGKLLDDKGYGIAMRKNSPYRTRLSTAVLKLQASGKIATLKRKWWEERRGGGACSGELDASNATPLGLKNVEGVFYVTIFGVVGGVLVVTVEMLFVTFNMSRRNGTTFREALLTEVKFFFNFNSTVKPVIYGNKTSSQSINSKLSSASSPSSSSSSSSSSTNSNENVAKPKSNGIRNKINRHRPSTTSTTNHISQGDSA